MPAETIDTLIGRLRKRVGTLPDYFLLQEWIVQAYEDYWRRMFWSWRKKQGRMLFYTPYNTGTVSITRGSNVATFSGSALTADMVGRQLRAGGNDTPILTITGLISSTSCTLDDTWTYTTVSGVAFEIYQAYVTMPDDFESFISIPDLTRNLQLDHWTHSMAELDSVDPKRAFGGSVAYWAVLKDYVGNANGPVSAPVQAHGTGDVPTAGGAYSGPADATFIVEMIGATTFKWKKDSGSYTTGVAVDGTGAAQDLQDGVQVAFPPSGTYDSGDVFAIRATAGKSGGNARYEFWPHIKTDSTRPYLYYSRPPALTDSGAALPWYVSAQAVTELAMVRWANWPGTPDKPNPANALGARLALYHANKAETMLVDLEREDANRETVDLVYDAWTNFPVIDSGYLASHDIGYELNLLDA